MGMRARLCVCVHARESVRKGAEQGGSWLNLGKVTVSQMATRLPLPVFLSPHLPLNGLTDTQPHCCACTSRASDSQAASLKSPFGDLSYRWFVDFQRPVMGGERC